MIRFAPPLCSALLTKFFPETAFQTSALECLTEIAGLVDLDPRYNALFQQMFVVLVKQVRKRVGFPMGWREVGEREGVRHRSLVSRKDMEAVEKRREWDVGDHRPLGLR